MSKLSAAGPIVFGCAFLWMGAAHAQRGGAAEWTTIGGDAQRSSWLRTDPKISKESMQKPGFQFLWKIKFNNDPKQLNALTPPSILGAYIGYRGFRSLAFVGGSSDNVFAIDTDLGRTEWQKHLSGAGPAAGSWACPGGMTASLTRPTSAAFPGAALGGRGGRGRAARGGVGDPGEGAVTIKEVNAAAARAPAPAPPAGRGRGAAAPNMFARGASWIYAVTSDGMLHSLYVSNGEEPQPPVAFLPAGADAHGLIVVDNVAYAATSGGCGGAADGLWALDIASKEVHTWKSGSGGVAGSVGPAFGPEGEVYVATDGGELVALEAKTLSLKNAYKAGLGFSSSPVLFQYKDKTLIAAATKDGQIHLLDAAALATPLSKTPANSANFAPAALASWQDSAGTRWLLAPSATAIVAWKVADQNGTPSLQPGWTSRDMVSPLPPMIINGVVFAVSSGEFRSSDLKMTAAQRAQRSTPAVLYAVDSANGKELWNSGKTMTSFIHGGGLSGGSSQIYLGTYDGTFYAFGFWIEH
jgi:outer membrane protein assembly factor BamB